MTMNTLFGINGSGKDTVANELQQRLWRRSKLVVTSMSRMSMYLLGITDNFDAARSVRPEAYRTLEQVPQKQMVELESGPYKDLVEDLAGGG